MTRLPARDQPQPEVTAELVAGLRRSVEDARRRAGSTVVRGPEPHRWVRVILGGARASLSLEEHGQVVAERDVDTAWLLEHMSREGQRYADLAALLEGDDP